MKPVIPLTLAVLSVALGACARSEPPPRFAPPAPARVDGDADTRTEALEAPDTGPGSSAIATPTAAQAAPTPPADTPVPAAFAATAAPQVDDELCRAACQNALAVTLAELPESAIASMRDELTRALRDDCPARCIAKSSLESARCIATAKTALALASCP